MEIEIKVPVRDERGTERKLKKLRARLIKIENQTDTYYSAPDRDFARTDEALRIRCAGRRKTLAYKGPKIDTRSKSREEVETEVEDAEKVAKILNFLGYKKVATVRKRRKIYRLSRPSHFTISLDRVQKLGSFLEVESVGSERDLPRLRNGAFELIEKIGVKRTECIRESYLEMMLKGDDRSRRQGG